MQKYDLIGDIHGHADELEELLEELGYSRQSGYYNHPERQVIFLGDFIDRGPKQRDVLNIVVPMVEQNSALAVMGNHEFNALAFHTEDPEKPGSWLRPRSNKNIRQHIRFLDEYLQRDQNELDRVLEFFFSLPLWLDLEGLRVVHACWASSQVSCLGSNILTRRLLIEASREGTDKFNAIEVLLKGVEHKLPAGISFNDEEGFERDAVRTRWWTNKDSRIRNVALTSHGLPDSVGNMIIRKDDLGGYGAGEKPVFIGHYWWDGEPERLSDNVACLDYSVAKDGGKLVAYRWSGESKLSNKNFIYV
jgi:hypothetical protein